MYGSKKRENSVRKIVLFDGECHLCHKSVSFIIKRDPKRHFQFASQQSEIGQQLLREAGAPTDVNHLILIEGARHFEKSTAALRICRHLKGWWKLCSFLLLVPRPFRDAVYHIVSKNRHKWIGSAESCLLPSPEVRDRFL